MPEEQAKFEGWAIVEVMGHQKYAGFVTTEAYGGAGSIYCITPCTEEVARKATEEGTIRKHNLLSVPPLPAAAAAFVSACEEDDSEL